MAEVTYYVALPFVAADDGIAPGEAVECFNPNAAVMRADWHFLSPRLVEEIAVGAPRFQRRRRSGHRQVEEAQRSLVVFSFLAMRHFPAPPAATHDPSFVLPREQGVFEANKQRGRSGIYLDASGLSQRALREPAAKQADGRDLRPPRCFGIVGRVTDRDGVGAAILSFLRTSSKIMPRHRHGASIRNTEADFTAAQNGEVATRDGYHASEGIVRLLSIAFR
jgi:hypothetical protein